MGAGKWPWILKLAQYLKLIGAGFSIFPLVFVSRDFEVGSKYESSVRPKKVSSISMKFGM